MFSNCHQAQNPNWYHILLSRWHHILLHWDNLYILNFHILKCPTWWTCIKFLFYFFLFLWLFLFRLPHGFLFFCLPLECLYSSRFYPWYFALFILLTRSHLFWILYTIDMGWLPNLYFQPRFSPNAWHIYLDGPQGLKSNIFIHWLFFPPQTVFINDLHAGQVLS